MMIDATRGAGALLALCALALPFPAQSSGAETRATTAQATLSAAGTSTGSFASLQSGVGQAFTGPLSTSESFAFVDGVVSIGEVPGTNRPFVFGVAQGVGDKDGGEDVTVFGFNFTALAAGATSVEIGGLLSPVVTVLDNNTITARTPAGLDALGNPVAATSVRVTNSIGSMTAPRGLVFGPALLQLTAAQIGKLLSVTVLSEPLSLNVIAFGGIQPPFPLALAAFDGQLALSNNAIILTTPALPATRLDKLEIALPDFPPLVGKTVELQALSITDLVMLDGSFTNVLPIAILP